MKKTTIVAIILGVLVLISLVQAFQLNGLKTKLAEGKVVSSAGSATSTASAGGSAGKTSPLPSSVQNLPQMVGGC